MQPHQDGRDPREPLRFEHRAFSTDVILIQREDAVEPQVGMAALAVPVTGTELEPVMRLVMTATGQHHGQQPAPMTADDQQWPVLAAAWVLLIGHPRPDDLTGISEPVQIRGVLQSRRPLNGVDLPNGIAGRPGILVMIKHQRSLPALPDIAFMHIGFMII